jgi:hypothetical protein
MKTTFRIVIVLVVVALLLAFGRAQEVRTLDKQIKVYIHAPHGEEAERQFVGLLSDRLTNRGEVKILKTTKGYDFVISLIVDVMPDFDRDTRPSEDTPPPPVYVVSMVVTTRDVKETYKKHNLQADRSLERIADRSHKILLRTFAEGK